LKGTYVCECAHKTVDHLHSEVRVLDPCPVLELWRGGGGGGGGGEGVGNNLEN